MNIIPSSFMRLRGLLTLSRGRTGIQQLTAEHVGYPGFKQQGFYRSFSSWFVSSTAARPLVSRHPGPLSSQAEGSGVIQLPLWQYQQIRTRKRGTEYQPKNIKRKRTHGWIKRLSTRGGIEVILRRMLKGRKSLTH